MKSYLKIYAFSLLIICNFSCNKDKDSDENLIADAVDAPDVILGTTNICDAKGNGKLYEVGPGKEYENIIDVPTENLGPGDAVRIYAKSEAYYERLIIATKGTKEEPICVCGVPDEAGKLPILDGTNARVRPVNVSSYFNENTAYLGIIVIARNYGNHPEYINVSNLQIQGAHQYMEDDSQQSYIMGTDELKPYSRASSGVYMRGSHIQINNCLVRHNGNGIFGAYNSANDPLIDVRLNNNIIQHNGTYDVSQQHNIYIESEGLVSIGNQFGPVREGAKGTNYKSRSAGDVIMYNYFVGPAARQINLAESENSVDYFPGLTSFQTTYVAGNIIEGNENGSATMLHYGNDNVSASPMERGNRKGTLYSYNNTFVIKSNIELSYRKIFFDVTFCEGTLKAFNNVLYYENNSSNGDSQISFFRESGTAGLVSNNLISTATIAAYNTKYIDEDQRRCAETSLDFKELESMLASEVDFGLDKDNLYKLTSSSKAIDAGMDIPSEVLNLEFQFKSPSGVEPRTINGAAIDIGAFEFN
ncbi:right-handed parallel beta-helix repeat-containing protein [Maribacter ulvicola]|uniref:Right handed beta helix region n=1 Tax=Maribacter ulvicola TaxID=228959 RepID=A0A1N6U027_9FLAO|nr:hypothetical protein [Maribacter ulvicola]SIQ58985.1 hypothetical protein SAMN05421797_102151 [Maribacter ulvicola]